MKVLHTSDWHIGKTLFSKKRYDEFEKFLSWLVETIQTNNVDVLLVAGDVFDTTTPSNKALELYYSFLSAASKTCCRRIVVTGGNHDSSTSLDAPKLLLDVLDISVVGAARGEAGDEVVVLRDDEDKVELVVCAVPYLRERDIRVADAVESITEKAEKLKTGVREHYKRVIAEANKIADGNAPVIVMGHLFAASAMSSDSDSERELYVGSLAHVDITEFPADVDYYALGHLHVRQKVAGNEDIRYSGSPLPMSFAEAGGAKSVVLLEFGGGGNKPAITEIDVPVFQKLRKISGSIDEIVDEISVLKNTDENVWIEVEYTGTDVVSDLKDVIDQAVSKSGIEVCRVRNNAMVEYSLSQIAESTDVELSEIDNLSVFRKCLQMHDVSDEQAGELEGLYSEIVHDLTHDDKFAE